ncbi:MAG: SDR family oxidoreductase [Cytophagaceae bacterium]|nr:SDR family oxidoreductase [Cytophagaceae bacterium]MBL0301472.1 SDR family oxidoreductase [Cytophagaceae bacterium]MBL0324293.1 SDR family oxidoreductase [Cytophagaceae bacterium]
MSKTAIITGGSKGIGLGVAEAMLKEGINVVITGRDIEALGRAEIQLNALSQGKTLVLEADVRNMADMKNVVASTLEKFGGVDYLIANAGVGHFANIIDLSEEQWNDTIDINLTGVFNSVKATLEALIKSQGYVITIASLAGTNFFANGSAYNASKFGLVGFSQAIMLDLRDKGIKVSTIMPGSVATFFNGHEPTGKDDWKIQPEDIGQIVVDLIKMPARTLPSKVEVRPSQTK